MKECSIKQKRDIKRLWIKGGSNNRRIKLERKKSQKMIYLNDVNGFINHLRQISLLR